METTRQQIIQHLQEKNVATASEIGNALGVTPANIRHHLAILKNEGVVQIIGQRPTTRRGRPTHLYTLVHQAQRHNLDGLASAMLDEFISFLSPEDLDSALEQLSNRLLKEQTPPKSNLTQRLYQAVTQLNQLNYRARWEAHAKAPHLILGHCPFAAILPEHPELCHLDAHLIERIIIAPVKQTDKLTRDDLGMTYCTFVVEES